MSSRRMSLSSWAALRSDSEQFIYNWMLEDDLGLDWGNRMEAKRTREKAENPGSHAGSRSSKEDTGKKRALLCKLKLWCGFMQTIPGSHAESRFSKKETQEQRALLCNKSWWGFTQTKILSVMLDQGRQKGLRYKLAFMQIGRTYTENQISGLYGIAREYGRKRKPREDGLRNRTRIQ